MECVVSPQRDSDLHAALFDLLVPESKFSSRVRALHFQAAAAPVLAADSLSVDARTVGELRSLAARLAEALDGSSWIDDFGSREWSEVRVIAKRILSDGSAR